MSAGTLAMTAESIFLAWILENNSPSNVELADWSNVCRPWRRVLHNIVLRQAEHHQHQQPLLLLPSMLHYILTEQQPHQAGRRSLSSSSSPSQCNKKDRPLWTPHSQNETFCALWLQPEGIRDIHVPLNYSRDDELRDIEAKVQTALWRATHRQITNTTPESSSTRFAPSGQDSVSSDEDVDERNSNDRRRNKAARSQSPAVRRLSPPQAGSPAGAQAAIEWSGYRAPMQVLRHFGYSSDFVVRLLEAAAQQAGWRQSKDDRSLLPSQLGLKAASTTKSSLAHSSATFAVRGATVARPESYCLCLDQDNLDDPEAVRQMLLSHDAMMSESSSSDDEDEEETAEIRLQALQEFLVRKEQQRRELQREVLPRVILSSPYKGNNGHPPSEGGDEQCDSKVKTQQRSVQFLNASKYHAVCMLTPAFACGPLVEPITILCVGIATEDGCFLSGLHHRFEVGHLYPEDEPTELVERSAFCVTTEDWVDDWEPADNLATGEQNCSRNNGSTDESESDHHGNSGETPCRCLYRSIGTKVDEFDDDDEDLTGKYIHRGRFAPGSWHCYTVVVDGPRTVLRVDGQPEAVQDCPHPDFDLPSSARPRLDGVTLGSDHCFGISLCCGQHMDRGGDGAMAEIAVFSGRLDSTDLACLEDQMMRRHGIPPSSWNDLQRRAETLFLWPPPASLTYPQSVPLHYLSRHRRVSWKQYDPVTGDPVRISRIGARNACSSSDW